MPSKPKPPQKSAHSTARIRQKPRRPKPRRLYCDCGQPAITVLVVKVGSNPQYLVRLPVCPACLAVEQGLLEV